MIERLLPAAVAVAETRQDVPLSTLYPAEAALVANAVAKRRNEFAAARHCARQALAQLGCPPAPILPGERGAPQWPDGFLGSMTHCAGYRAAAVARVGTVPVLGIDAEPAEPLPDGVLRLVALPAETAMLAELDRHRLAWDRLLFSAKESVYKAWFPLARRWLDFSEAQITISTDGGLTARLLVPGPVDPANPDRRVTGFAGRWSVADGLVATALSAVSD